MTGLSVLYAKGAAKETGWARVAPRDRTGRLREVYWARCAETASRRRSSFGMVLTSRPDRNEVMRGPSDPGDGLIYKLRLFPSPEGQFEWVEVTEVFTTVSAKQIEGAMSAWNGIQSKHQVDFAEFRRAVRRGRPTRADQRRAADKVIEQVRKKLRKTSYQELAERYGYGTLVVGMPLWFAVPPDDPFRAVNALDDFLTRTWISLEEMKRTELRRAACPFRKVIVTWDTTPEAMDEWRHRRSPDYEDVANASLCGLVPGSTLLDRASSLMFKAAIPESDMPSRNLHITVKTKKKRSGIGPYPELVQLLGQFVPELEDKGDKVVERVRTGISLTLCKLLWFRRLHGTKGLRAWVARKMSVSHAFKVRAAQRRARLLYRESMRRKSA